MDGRLAAAPEGPTIAPDAPEAKAPERDLRELAAELRRIVGDEWVYTQEHQLRTYESDGLLQYRATPAAAVLPGTAEEVQQVVAACARAEVPWVARGAGSGLSGGALPVEDGVLLVVSRMKRILEIDLDNGRMCVEPGVTNANVSAAVGPAFFYPPDPSSQIVCSIGGNVAENSGGAHCFKYGFTTNYVTGLELVLTDGSLIQVGGYELDPPGYDLLGAFVGSEGTLGVATKVWLRVVPSPETVRTMVAFFDNTREAGEAVSEIVQGGVVPGAIEMMDAKAIEAAEQAAKAGFPMRGAALLVELDGSERECDARFEEVTAICERNGSDDVRVARDEPERQRFWKARKAAFAAMGRISPNYFVQDGVIPRTKLPDVLERIDALRERVRPDRGQRLPRRRRQPAPARVLRRRRRGRGRARRGAVRPDPRGVPRGRRVDHRRARRRRRQEAPHAEDVRGGGPRRVPAPALRVRPRRSREPRQGDADAAPVRRGAG